MGHYHFVLFLGLGPHSSIMYNLEYIHPYLTVISFIALYIFPEDRITHVSYHVSKSIRWHMVCPTVAFFAPVNKSLVCL